LQLREPIGGLHVAAFDRVQIGVLAAAEKRSAVCGRRLENRERSGTHGIGRIEGALHEIVQEIAHGSINSR
jgi:hypothetical protein